MSGGSSFIRALTDWLLRHKSSSLADTLVFVPTSRVAARVRALLASEMTGVLPAVLPLKGNGELADLLGIELGNVVQEVAARLEIARILRNLTSTDDGHFVQQEATVGERLWRRVDGLYALMDRLGLYGLTVQDLRRTVPQQMVGLWEVQAATLIEVMAQMERWLARRNEVMPGTAERRVLEQTAMILEAEDCPWRLVMAGILDGIPAAHAVAQVAARKGDVLVPDAGALGLVTAELAQEFEMLLDAPAQKLDVRAGALHEVVAENDWDEAWLAALAVKRSADEGRGRVAVVSPSGTLLSRVEGLLQRWGMVVHAGGGVCLDATPEGRRILAVTAWGLRQGKMGDWLNALRGMEPDVVIGNVIESELSGLDAWLDADDWHAVLRVVLKSHAAPAGVVSEGVALLRPLEARLMDFDVVIAAGCVEGVWPANSADAWLSEAHLRALNLPDSIRKAQLAGTEFETLVAGGSTDVFVLRSRTTDGREMVESRFVTPLRGRMVFEHELGDVLEQLRGAAFEVHGTLGEFHPHGGLWPKKWSASFVEAMLACPYKALGERILGLRAPDPLTPIPDARQAGLLAHRWLEKVGKEIFSVSEDTVDATVKRLIEIGDFELRHEPAVVRAIWKVKFAKLAPALVARWLADGRTVTTVEKRLAHEVGAVTVTATLDRVEESPSGKVIIDFKTSTPPSFASVASGEKPQLAIEAWLMQTAGEIVDDVEYWQLRGYGSKPLSVSSPSKIPLAQLIAPVGDGLVRLTEAHTEGAAFPAVPDMEGGGLMATGHCAWCELAGVCRRKDARL